MIDNSTRVRARDFREPWFMKRLQEMGEPVQMHRKFWEFAIIAQVFAQTQAPGALALGFGVGKEPLATWIASRRALVVATDRPDTTKEWTDTDQHAMALLDTFNPKQQLVTLDGYETRATFQPVDMNAIPDHLKAGLFDFTWSCGSFEHLGSKKHGMDFFVDQMKCLKPGGVAAHTTEYNVGENPLESTDLSLYTDTDFRVLERALADQGDRLWPLCLTPGAEKADRHVDSEPYGLPHLTLGFGPGGTAYKTTSVLLVATRG